MKTVLNRLMIVALLFAGSQVAMAKGVSFDLLAGTPVGSWQEREDITTDHKGRQTVVVSKTSLVGKETRNGKNYYWVEVVMDNYKVKKKSGKRKKQGDTAIMKSLIAEDALKVDPENIMTNLRGFGEEVIVQNGNQKPMRMSGAGGFLGGMMKAFGAEIKIDYTQQGSESVTVPAGTFSTKKINGAGTTEFKVVFKKTKIETDSTLWVSSKVPFGMVKGESTSFINGKESASTSTLLSYGKSGAESLITEEPTEMPNLGDIFNQ